VGALTPRRVPTSRGPIEVAESGSGPAALVAHGLPGDYRQARTVAEDLEHEARVLLVSRPGYGQTPLRSGRTPQEQASLYAALLDALAIDKAVVLGISGGGPSAYAFAAAYPARCQGLLLCCAASPHLMTLPAAMLRLAAVPGVWRAAAAATRVVARHAPKKTLDLSVLTPVERALTADPSVLADLQLFEAERRLMLHGAGLRNDTRQLAARREIAWPATASVRTVVLHGDADDIVPLSHGEVYSAVVPGARLEVLAGYGHAVPLFARCLVAQLLRELLTT
jgi:pimeloyl-ACP methyl ester carboxylesterase